MSLKHLHLKETPAISNCTWSKFQIDCFCFVKGCNGNTANITQTQLPKTEKDQQYITGRLPEWELQNCWEKTALLVWSSTQQNTDKVVVTLISCCHIHSIDSVNFHPLGQVLPLAVFVDGPADRPSGSSRPNGTHCDTQRSLINNQSWQTH